MYLFLETLTKKYFDFKGRSSRKEYWIWTLVHLPIMAIVLYMFFAIAYYPGAPRWFVLTFLALLVYVLLTLIPSIAVSVRRLHDIGFSGWWYFLMFLPYVGPIAISVLACMPSVPDSNIYGASPYATQTSPSVVPNL